jgi:hypothetical protein
MNEKDKIKVAKPNLCRSTIVIVAMGWDYVELGL